MNNLNNHIAGVASTLFGGSLLTANKLPACFVLSLGIGLIPLQYISGAWFVLFGIGLLLEGASSHWLRWPAKAAVAITAGCATIFGLFDYVPAIIRGDTPLEVMPPVIGTSLTFFLLAFAGLIREGSPRWSFYTAGMALSVAGVAAASRSLEMVDLYHVEHLSEEMMSVYSALGLTVLSLFSLVNADRCYVRKNQL